METAQQESHMPETHKRNPSQESMFALNISTTPARIMSSTAPQQQMKEHTIVHFDLPASNPEKLSQFYSSLFGWQFTKYGDQPYWLIATKDAKNPTQESMGGMYKREDQPEHGVINYFLVKNIDESIAKAKSLGARVISEKTEIPQVGWSAALKDPENNTFAFFQANLNPQM
jgi:uncharacterized protein